MLPYKVKPLELMHFIVKKVSATLLSFMLTICQQAILPQQFGYFTGSSTASIWLYVVLSRSEHSRLAVSRVDSHWKATTEGASQTVSCLQVHKRVQLVGLQHQHQPLLCNVSRCLINQIYYSIRRQRPCCYSLVHPVSSWSLSPWSLGSVCRLHTPANPA